MGDADARLRAIRTRLDAARTAGLADADSGDIAWLVGRVAELTAALRACRVLVDAALTGAADGAAGGGDPRD